MTQVLETEIQFPTRSISALPNIVYYNDNHILNDSPRCTATVAHQIGCTWSLATTMMELSREIEYGADLVAFHIEMIDRSNLTVLEFVHSIITLAKFAFSHQNLKIMIVIKPTTPRGQVLLLKNLPISIGLDINYYSLEQTAISCQQLISGTRYWPQDLIDQLPVGPELPISVYFREDHKTYVTDNMAEHMKKNARFRLQCCTDWSELSQALQNNPHQLVFHISMLTRLDLTISEIITSLQTKMKLHGVAIPIAVAIDPDTPVSVIKELKRSGVFGLVPSAGHWGTEATVTALNALVDRQSYWPRHIIDQLPGNKPVVEKAVDGIQLTKRQQEVMDLICHRGLSNKQIAKSLNLSESTVKIHVSAVMRLHGVRNRTQLALSAGTGLTA